MAPIDLWPLGFYGLLILALIAGILMLSYALGQRHSGHATGEPYESGVPGTGSGRAKFASSYYVVALFFIVFDVEAAFLFAWAQAARELGWRGFIGVCLFIGVLVVALIYEWRLGVLSFRSEGRGEALTS